MKSKTTRKKEVKGPTIDYPMTKLVQNYLGIDDKYSKQARKLRRIFRLNGQGIRKIRKGLHS